MSEARHNDALFPERFVPEQMRGLIEVEHLARYIWASSCAAGRRVLDAGCGVGYGSLLLQSAGAVSVTGVDIAQEAVDAARARAADVVQFMVGDISALSFDNGSFELVVCFEAIEHVIEQERALDELRRVLTPDGLLVVSSPNRDVYEAGNPHHTHEYIPEELRSALSERFANVQLVRQQAWLAGMICNDEALADADPERILDVEVRKVSAVAPGSESFTLALASDIQLPATGSSAMFTSLDELSSWRERVRSAEAHLEDAHKKAVEIGDAYASICATYDSIRETYEALLHDYQNTTDALKISENERGQQEQRLNRASTLLAERNAALRLSADELVELRTQVDKLEAGLDASRASLAVLAASRSWRMTAPLRALARILRR